MSDHLKLEKRVHIVEKKYGSIANAPYNCRELIACRKIVAHFSRGRIDQYDHVRAKQIRDLAKELYFRGFSVAEVAEKMDYSISEIRYFLKSYNLPFTQFRQNTRFRLWIDKRYIGEGTMKSLAKQLGESFGWLAMKYVSQNGAYSFERIEK